MLNFKFLKWAALCGLLVFALGGCAKDEPCGGNQASISTDENIAQSAFFMYVNAETGHPLIRRYADSLSPYKAEDVRFELAEPFSGGDGGLGVYETEATEPRSYVISMGCSSCHPKYPSLFQLESSGLCFKGYIHLNEHETDTLEVYAEIDTWNDCEISGRNVYYINGLYVGEGELGQDHPIHNSQGSWFEVKK
jgi:hypothetical protein